MKKITYMLCMFILFGLTGCTLNYNLKVNDDMLIEENLNILETNNFLSTVTLNKEDFINDLINQYSSMDEYVDYNYNTILKSDISGAEANKSFLDFYDYRNKNLLYKYFFSNIDINEQGDVLSLKFVAVTKNDLFSSNSQELSTLDNANISISLPFVVISSNADVIDSENNIYTWKYNEDNYNKNIEITFDKNNAFKSKISIEMYVLFGIIVIFVSTLIYVFYRYKKNSNL